MRRILWLVLSLIVLSAGPAWAQMSSGTTNAKQSGTWTVQPGNTANTTAWLVTGTGGTFPITGNLTGNQAINTVQLGGVAISLNTGVRDAGTQRVTIATNDVVPASQSGTWTVQPGNTANTTAWLMNVGSWGGTATTLGQKAMTASVPVVIASDQSSIATTQGALTSIVTFQQAVTTTATALPTNTAKSVCIKVLTAGTQTVYYGATGVTTGTGQELSAGDSDCMAIDNSNRIFVIAAATGSTIAGRVLN